MRWGPVGFPRFSWDGYWGSRRGSDHAFGDCTRQLQILSCLVDCLDPLLNFLRSARLEVVRPLRRNDTEGVVVPLESDGRTCVDISEVQELKEFVFGRFFVVDQMSSSQDEPTLLPSLDIYGHDINV